MSEIIQVTVPNFFYYRGGSSRSFIRIGPNNFYYLYFSVHVKYFEVFCGGCPKKNSHGWDRFWGSPLAALTHFLRIFDLTLALLVDVQCILRRCTACRCLRIFMKKSSAIFVNKNDINFDLKLFSLTNFKLPEWRQVILLTGFIVKFMLPCKFFQE